MTTDEEDEDDDLFADWDTTMDIEQDYTTAGTHNHQGVWQIAKVNSCFVFFVYALFGSVFRSDASKLFFVIGCPILHWNVSPWSYLQLAACLMLWRDYQSMFLMFLR